MAKILNEYVEYQLDEYPKTCKECPFIIPYPYRDNAYYGIAYDCSLSYMDHGDTREFDISHKRWPNCNIENNKSIRL